MTSHAEQACENGLLTHAPSIAPPLAHITTSMTLQLHQTSRYIPSLPILTSRSLVLPRARPGARHYAQVGPTTFVGKPPAPPDPPAVPGPGPSVGAQTPALPSSFDAHILAELHRNTRSEHALLAGSTTTNRTTQTQLPTLIAQYVERGGLVLEASLPYESRPAAERRVPFDAEEDAEASVAMVVHVAENGAEHKITYCSGFALSAPKLAGGQALYVTCAHTLEEVSAELVVAAVWRAMMSCADPL